MEKDEYIEKIENILNEGRALILEILSDDSDLTKEIERKCDAWLKRVMEKNVPR
jgi:hypothetical protein